MTIDIEKAKSFLKAISRLPTHEKSQRIHVYVRHKGQDCNNYTCKLPEDLDRKIALKKAMKLL